MAAGKSVPVIFVNGAVKNVNDLLDESGVRR
jgi:hypothetical protein